MEPGSHIDFRETADAVGGTDTAKRLYYNILNIPGSFMLCTVSCMCVS